MPGEHETMTVYHVLTATVSVALNMIMFTEADGFSHLYMNGTVRNRYYLEVAKHWIVIQAFCPSLVLVASRMALQQTHIRQTLALRLGSHFLVTSIQEVHCIYIVYLL